MGTLLHAVAHGLVAHDTIMLANLVGGTGLEENTLYYVLAAGLTADDFAVSESDGGAAIVFTTDVTAGSVVRNDTYASLNDGNMTPPTAIATPTGLALSSTVLTTPDGHKTIRLDISLVQPTSATLRHSVVTITGPSGDPMQVIIPVGQTIGMVQGAVGNTLYSAVARAYDVYGNVSAATAAVNHTTAYDTVAPAVPTGLTVVAGIKNVLVGFTGVADTDLDHYDIAVSTNGGSTFPTVYSSKTTVAAITELVVGTTYTIKVRAVDRSGNASAYTSTASGVPRAATGSGTGGTDIAAGSIAATDIKAGSITIGKLGAEERGNLGSEFFTDFTDVSAWSPAQGSGGLTATAVSDAQAGQYVGRIGDNSGNDEYWAQRNDGLLIPFDPNSLYRVHIRVRRNLGTGVLYAGVEGVAADGTTLVNTAGANTFSSQHYVAAAGAAPGSSFTDYIGYIKGTSGTPTAGTAKADPTSPGTVHSNVRYIRPMFLANYTAAAGQMDVDLFEITRVDNTSVINSTGYVTINSSGITILNGALTLQDANGTTVMTSGGFSGPWLDFIHLGLYNARFLQGVVGTIGAGRTSALSYWTVSDVAGTPTLAFVSGGGIKFTPSALNSEKRIVSDLVPVIPASEYAVPINFKATIVSGFLAVDATVFWYKADGTTAAATASEALAEAGTSATIAVTGFDVGLVTAPADALYAKLQVDIREITTHNAGNNLTLTAVGLELAPARNLMNSSSPGTRYVNDLEVNGDLSVDSNIVAIGTVKYPTMSCKAIRSSNLTVTGPTVSTAIPMNGTEEWDPYSMHDTATNPSRVTAIWDGKYQIVASAHCTPVATLPTRLILELKKNGSSVTIGGVSGTGQRLIMPNAATFAQHMQGTWEVALAAGDYIEIYCEHNSATSQTVSAAEVIMTYMGI